ncbi:unnamed protein product [Danaus chrysippus]|uniref:(African queen) hypothetical protein n=1 Tax=Danaus chrysippus TaxID=151541 RepID=A0A8J2R2T4_9NEOP|nr:unnamed protein product [Danaus chrysippus]
MDIGLHLLPCDLFNCISPSHVPKEEKSFNSYGQSSERRATFQGVMKLTVMLGQFVGLNPVLGVSDVDSSKLRIFRGYEQATYFLYSLIFLIIRSLALSLIAARVHTVSRQPVYTLYELPSTDYGIEVQRFIDQIHGDTVALTGLQFFKVTRGIALAIAGTIVTYELVLMQFTGVTPAADIHTDDSTKV